MSTGSEFFAAGLAGIQCRTASWSESLRFSLRLDCLSAYGDARHARFRGRPKAANARVRVPATERLLIPKEEGGVKISVPRAMR